MDKKIKIQTANTCGGNLRNHRTIEAAAQRVARCRDVYLGYEVVSATPEQAEAIRERVQQILQDEAKGYYD